MILKKKTVVHVAPVHQHDDVRVFKKYALSLAAKGYDVTVICKGATANFRDGVRLIPPWGIYKNRATRFLSLPLVGFQALKLRADIYHLHNPDTIFIAWFLRLFGRKVIYDTHEDFSARILARDWLLSPLRRPIAQVVAYLEALTGRIVNYSIGTQRSVVERLGRRGILIENPPRVSDDLYTAVANEAETIENNFSGFRLVYVGAVHPARGLYEMVDALEHINQVHPCRLWLIGPTSRPDLLASARSRAGWKYVDYFPKMPQERAFAYISRSDAGLIYIHDVGDHSRTDPNKIYEYMTFSKPFIASKFDKWEERLSHLNAGIFVQPENAQNLASAVRLLIENPSRARAMGQNGRNYVRVHNWECEFFKIQEVYETL